jgi:hypothetical protein
MYVGALQKALKKGETKNGSKEGKNKKKKTLSRWT